MIETTTKEVIGATETTVRATRAITGESLLTISILGVVCRSNFTTMVSSRQAPTSQDLSVNLSATTTESKTWARTCTMDAEKVMSQAS